jgi:hypothetical protein
MARMRWIFWKYYTMRQKYYDWIEFRAPQNRNKKLDICNSLRLQKIERKNAKARSIFYRDESILKLHNALRYPFIKRFRGLVRDWKLKTDGCVCTLTTISPLSVERCSLKNSRIHLLIRFLSWARLTTLRPILRPRRGRSEFLIYRV